MLGFPFGLSVEFESGLRKNVLVKLELAESAGITDNVSGSASAEASLHTASCFQRSARTMRRSGTKRAHAVACRAYAPAPFAVSVRFQFVVIVFVSCGFPRRCSVRFFSPGFYSRACFSEPLARHFDQVQVRENHVQPELHVQAPLRRLRSDPSGVRSVVSALPHPAPARLRSSSEADHPPSVFPVYHPVPASCSARLLFVLFMVRILKFVSLLSSVRLPCFGLFVFPCSSLPASVRFRFRLPVLFLSSFSRVMPAHRRLIYIILAYIIH